MNITATAISLNVANVQASADFATTHFGFTEAMSADGFISLAHETAGVHIALLKVGLESFKPAEIAGPAGQGLLIAFVVEGIDEHFKGIKAAGAKVVTSPETEPWGERFCQFADPNGIVWQLVEWIEV